MLTFNGTNWNTPQAATVLAIDDGDTMDNNANIFLSGQALQLVSVPVMVTDDDVDLIVSTNTLTVDEGMMASLRSLSWKRFREWSG